MKILPPSLMSLRLFRITTSSNENRKTGIPIKIFTGVAYVPMVKTPQDICNTTKLLFGSEMYGNMWFNYVYPKKYIFKNNFITGAKINITESTTERTYEIHNNLEKLKSIPSYLVRNARNTIFDFSKLYNHTYPTKDMMSRAKSIEISETIGPEFLSYFAFGIRNNDQTVFSQSMMNLTVPGIFNSIVVSIPIESVNTRLMMSYLDDNVMIPRTIKTRPDDIFLLSLARFILRYYEGDLFADNEMLRLLADTMNLKENVVFIFHNTTHAFILDMKDLKERDFKYDVVFRNLKKAFTNLIGITAGDISEKEAIENEKKDDIDESIFTNKELKAKVVDEKISNDEDETPVIDAILAKTDDTNTIIKDKIKSLAITTKKVVVKHSNKIDNDEDIEDKSEDEDEENDEELYLTDEELAELKEDSENTQDIFKDIDENVDYISEEEPTEEGETDASIEKEVKTLNIIKENTQPTKTPAQIRRIEMVRDKYKTIKLDDDRTIEEILNDVNTVSIVNNKAPTTIRDDSLNFSTLMDFEKSYVDKTMTKDMVKIVKSFSENKSINMHIIDAKKEDTSDQFTEKTSYTFFLEDEDQKKHKIKFDMPKVDSNGFMKINGNTKVLKKQLIMLPVAKLKPDQVMITSNYNKVFIYRQGSILNKNVIMLKKIFSMFVSDTERSGLHNINILTGNNSKLNKNYVTSIEYDEIAKMFHVIAINKGTHRVKFFFNQKELRKEIATVTGAEFKNNKLLPIGIDYSNNTVITVDVTSSTSVCDVILSYIKEFDIIINFDDFIKKISVPRRRMYSRMTLQSKDFPLIVFLSSLFSFTKVVNAMKADIHFIPKKTAKEDINFDKLSMLSVQFMDGTLYYSPYPIENALLLNGLSELDTKTINFSELDTIKPYLDYIYDVFKTRNLYKGWTAFKELFIDPITHDILVDFKLPTDFLELFLYANDLLSDNNCDHESYLGNWRMRGYEILNVLLYDTISQEYGRYKQFGKAREGFSIPDDAIFKALHKSFIMENYDAINPVNELKTKSIITYKGPHGINLKEAFKLSSRGQTESMIGTIGIASLDNAGVGISKQLTDNPRVKSTRGYLDPTQTDDIKKLKYGNLMTPEEAVIPFINRDDPKRIGFASGQTKHVIPVTGSMPPLVLTGAEQSIVYKLGDDFAFKAKQDGVCKAIFEKEGFAVVEYKDKSCDRVEFGQKLNRNSNFYIGNNMALNISLNQKFKKGDVLTYNEDFFKKHLGKLLMTQGAYARLVITEGENTEEDSCAITEEFSRKLSTAIIKRKQITLNAHANIVSYSNIGDHVKHGDYLMSYEDQKEEGADSELYNLLGDVDEDVLNKIMRHAPKSHTTGKILDMRVYWTISPDLMSDSCRDFVISYTKKILNEIKKEESITGKKSNRRKEITVSTPYRGRINGAELNEDGGILIEYFIGDNHGMIAGDKLTFNSSLKSIVSDVIPSEFTPYRLSGDGKIDAIMSMISINARQIVSVEFSGMIGKILMDYGRNVGKEFFEELGE